MEKRQERTLTNGDTEAATCQRGFQARQRVPEARSQDTPRQMVPSPHCPWLPPSHPDDLSPRLCPQGCLLPLRPPQSTLPSSPRDLSRRPDQALPLPGASQAVLRIKSRLLIRRSGRLITPHLPGRTLPRLSQSFAPAPAPSTRPSSSSSRTPTLKPLGATEGSRGTHLCSPGLPCGLCLHTPPPSNMEGASTRGTCCLPASLGNCLLLGSVSSSAK
ncbi:uncharacterized protein [Symphalangus syndactylus]|uniref:uncharacterized protein isoform X1 n=1 Tax=Symphalangus syndactylus TaxID=9590 RepID=UPI002442C8C5|nr:uncharacterized protein LOC129472709 isoform X1 [Symphalangus syndactylus]